jgi:hypothetical protein
VIILEDYLFVNELDLILRRTQHKCPDPEKFGS